MDVPIGSRPTSALLSSYLARTSGGLSPITTPQYGHAGRPDAGGAPPPPPAAAGEGSGAGCCRIPSWLTPLPLPYILLRSGSGSCSVALHPDWGRVASSSPTAASAACTSFLTVIGSPSSILSSSPSQDCASAIQKRNGIRSAKMYTQTRPPPADLRMTPSTIDESSILPALRNSACAETGMLTTCEGMKHRRPSSGFTLFCMCTSNLPRSCCALSTLIA